MKRILPLLLILLLILTGCSAQNADSPAADAPTDTPMTGISYVQIDVKDYGTIVAELYADTAPITVANFLSLVDSGFYDGLTFHRIISGFMIQGGDPERQRHGRFKPADQGRIQRQRRAERPKTHARCPVDGAVKRDGQRQQPILHHARGCAAFGRAVRRVRQGHQRDGGCGRDLRAYAGDGSEWDGRQGESAGD